jgi:glucokinase
MLLAGDIGGTKTDLGIYSLERGSRAPLALAAFPSASYPSLAAMVREFLATTDLEIELACFDVAGPVISGRAKVTNLPWALTETQLAEELQLKTVYLLNDLEAIGHAVPGLLPEELHAINAGEPSPGGTLAVIAPGTGLGEAFLTWDGTRYQAHPSEGGHADFAPATELQVDLLAYLLRRLGHVSIERVCSGIGLPNLYDFLRDSGRVPESPELAARLATATDRARVITDAAVRRPDPDELCAATIDLFASILAAEAGNLALKVLATGGVYIGGGIPPRILPALEPRRFMRAFADKGRLGAVLSRVPVHVIMGRAALTGTAMRGLELMAEGARTCSSA